MILTTWCGDRIDTKDYDWTIYVRWVVGWVRVGWTRDARVWRRNERRRRGQEL